MTCCLSAKAHFSLFILDITVYVINLWNISQASLRSFCFSLLWLKPETLIVPIVVFIFFPSVFPSSLFTRAINLWAYTSAEFVFILLLASRRPMPDSTCWSSSAMVLVSLGRPCAPSTYVVATMYASSSLRR